jgi:hypothetical protein
MNSQGRPNWNLRVLLDKHLLIWHVSPDSLGKKIKKNNLMMLVQLSTKEYKYATKEYKYKLYIS